MTKRDDTESYTDESALTSMKRKCTLLSLVKASFSTCSTPMKKKVSTDVETHDIGEEIGNTLEQQNHLNVSSKGPFVNKTETEEPKCVPKIFIKSSNTNGKKSACSIFILTVILHFAEGHVTRCL